MRAPILLYRLRMGWLLGHRFVLLTHVGRKSGARRHTVLEVVCHLSESRTLVVASGWGQKAQWLQNIMARPDVEVTWGAWTHRAMARRMQREAAEAALRTYARRHPRAMKQLARVILGTLSEGGEGDVVRLAEQVPLVELRLVDVAL